MPSIDHPAHALIGPMRDQRRHLAEAHAFDTATVPVDRLPVVHDLAHSAAPALPDDPALTPAGFAGRARAAADLVVAELDALRVLDARLARDLAAGCSTRLAVRFTGGEGR